jgi:DUF1365 family protein
MGMTTASVPGAETIAQRAIPAVLPKGILHARITHVRYTPKRYVLRHRLWYLAIRLSDLPRLNRMMLGFNRARPFSLRDRDYGRGEDTLEAWIRRAFDETGLVQPDGEVVLVTLPRVLGIGFNPVSFWLCHDAAGQLTAVLAEVHNTFGERHSYLARNTDGSPIRSGNVIRAEKIFYVSPFLPVNGEYLFRFDKQEDSLAISIDLMREGARVMSATIAGRFAPLSNKAHAVCFLRYPLPAIQVIGFIHYHAARLYMRGLSIFERPAPPAAAVSCSMNAITKIRGRETQ